MTGKKITLLFALMMFLAPFVQCQTQSDTMTMKGRVGEETLLYNNDLHVWLQNGHAGSEVCLGSERFLEDRDFRPAVGDLIEVTGTRAGNGSLLVGNSLQIGGKTLKLAGASAATGCAGWCGHCSGQHYTCCHDRECYRHHHGHCCDHE